MLSLFPELELTTEEQPTVSAAGNTHRRRKIRRVADNPQLALPFELSASQIRLRWMGGRGRKDPSAREIAEACQLARDAEEWLNDGRRRDGYDLAVLFAEAAVRHATQCLHTWSRMWDCRIERQTDDDGGRAYRKILQQAWLAWEWIEEADREPPLITFREACDVLSCRPEELRDGIYRGGIGICPRRAVARDAEPVGVEAIGEPGENDLPAPLSVPGMAWLGVLAGIEESLG